MHYLPVIVAALTVLILGYLNPKSIQVYQNGQATGHPSYMWLSLLALLAGLLSCYLMHASKDRMGGKIEYL